MIMKTLAQFIQHKRDEIGLSPKGLAKECNLPLNYIEDIEAGKELFLPVTVRQNLAKVLKCLPEEIKSLEKDSKIFKALSNKKAKAKQLSIVPKIC